MTATILPFTKKPKITSQLSYRIPLFTEEEIEVTIIAVNTFCMDNRKYFMHDLVTLDSTVVVDCVRASVACDYFSPKFKSVANLILSNVEVLST